MGLERSGRCWRGAQEALGSPASCGCSTKHRLRAALLMPGPPNTRLVFLLDCNDFLEPRHLPLHGVDALHNDDLQGRGGGSSSSGAGARMAQEGRSASSHMVALRSWA